MSLSAKTFFMDKTRTIGQKWLVNEHVLSFRALKRCTKCQLNPIILSGAIVSTDAGQRTQTNRFFLLRGSQSVKI